MATSAGPPGSCEVSAPATEIHDDAKETDAPMGSGSVAVNDGGGAEKDLRENGETNSIASGAGTRATLTITDRSTLEQQIDAKKLANDVDPRNCAQNVAEDSVVISNQDNVKGGSSAAVHVLNDSTELEAATESTSCSHELSSSVDGLEGDAQSTSLDKLEGRNNSIARIDRVADVVHGGSELDQVQIPNASKGEQDVNLGETQSKETEDCSGSTVVQPEGRDQKDFHGDDKTSELLDGQDEGSSTTAVKRIEISLTEAPRLTFVASDDPDNLTSTSIELDHRAPFDSSNEVASALEPRAEYPGELPGEDTIASLAEPGDYVGHSREFVGDAKSWQEEAPLIESQEVSRTKLTSKSFSTTVATTRSSSIKTTDRQDAKVTEDDQPQYMSLAQDEHLDASPLVQNKIWRPMMAAVWPDPPLEFAGSEMPTSHKGVAVTNDQSGGLVHSRSFDVITPQPSFSPSLRPTLSHDGASFFLPIQEIKVLQNSVMPDAPPELMSLIDSVVEGSDEADLLKVRKIVSGEDCSLLQEGVPAESVVSARLVVDILIAKMGGVEGLDEKKESTAPRVMLRAGPAIAASKLLPWLPCEGDKQTSMSPRTRMAKALALVLQACTRNRAMCSAAGLLRTLLLAAQVISALEVDHVKGRRWDPSPLYDSFEALGSHCLTVLDLREWLRTAAKTFLTSKALDLILTLERSISGEETRGPSHTFEFDGASSGLLGPGESRWPFTNGYAVATWLYIESFADTVSTAAAAAAIAAAASVKSNKTSAMSAAAAASALAGEGTAHMPRLFSFLSLDSLGVEAYFHGQYLVVDCVTGKGKKSSVHFTFPFKLRRWYFIGLEHTLKQGLLGTTDSEMKLYIDGRLCESRPLAFPRPSSLGFCCIGTNPPPAMAGLQKRRLQCPLFAEMGPIYIFKDPIGLDKMASLCARGGDSLSSFGAGAGVPWFANNEQAMSAAEDSAALDLEIGPHLHLLYHPKLLMGRSCPDASPLGAAGLHRKSAEVLGNVHVAARIRPIETIWAMADGGPMALLPLTVGAVDTDTLQPVIQNVEVSSAAALLSAPIFRMLSLTLQHAGNAEEIARSYAPRLLAYLLGHLVSVPTIDNPERMPYEHRTEERDEELVVAVVALAQAPKDHVALKVQLYSSLLLDLKLWSSCSYGLQKKLLSTLADMVFTEAETMRGANAVQMLLDGCRRCYWLIPEPDSVQVFAGGRSLRPAGELNALVDELLVVVDLLVGSSAYEPSLYTDICSLVQFVLDCPQPNQVARVLHLIFRLVVQPNASKAGIFAETLLASGGVEMLLTLLQREAELGETASFVSTSDTDAKVGPELHKAQEGVLDQTGGNGGVLAAEVKAVGDGQSIENKEKVNYLTTSKFLDITGLLDQEQRQWPLPTQEVVSVARSSAQRGANLGGISLSISADRARNMFRNVDSGDGIMVGIVSLLGALIGRGHLKAMSSTLAASQPVPKMVANPILGEGFPGASTTAVVWLLYAMEKAFQAAPKRLMTVNVYAALLPAVIRSEVGTLSSEDRLALYDCGHRFEHLQLLLVLVRSLPFAPRQLQLRALQDILLLACTHPENRTLLTTMSEWPEWLLEILLSQYESGARGVEDSKSFEEIEDLVYSFLAIMLEHSMRLKDGWKDVEATIHCAEWLTLVGGSSQGEHRLRREKSLPVIKRRILGNLVDFAASELHLQTQVVAAAAANVAAEGLSPRTARVEAEAAASLSMSLAENALVLLMLVEDHLRLESQYYYAAISTNNTVSGNNPFPPSLSSVPSRRHSAIGIEASMPAFDTSSSRRLSTTPDTGSLSLEVLATMADENGHISTTAMERLTASAVAEPFESVRCAFACYGSSGLELAASWKKRSQMWYGVGLPPRGAKLSAGAQGFDTWGTMVERDERGQWIELPLVRKSIAMLQALLLDDSGPGGGAGGIQGFGGGAGTGAGGAQLQQLLDSDQPFFAMVRMILVALREEDRGDKPDLPTDTLRKSSSPEVGPGSSKLSAQTTLGGKVIQQLVTRQAKSSLLLCVLAPLLTMQLFESRRQRVLVAVCIFYSEVWHAVNHDRKVLRKQYLEAIVPPFAALLRRWRPLLSGIHEFTDAEGQSPLAVEDRPLAIDAPPLEAALAMITPAWAAAFASPPASMALAMAAAGVSGGESAHPRSKRDSQSFENRASRLISLTSLQKSLDSPGRPQPTTPKDKATAKAVALAAARDQERAARVGSGRGLGAVAMATAWQRRTLTDRERTRRWNISEAMSNTWQEYDKGEDFAGINISESAHSLFGVLPAMVETARRMRILEVNRRSLAAAADEFGSTVGGRVWRSLVRRLQEMGALFGAIANQIGPLERVFWKLDSLENSLRMRKRLTQKYKGVDHQVATKIYRESQLASVPTDGIPLPPGALKLVPEIMTSGETGEDDSRSEEEEREEGNPSSRKEDSESPSKSAKPSGSAATQPTKTAAPAPAPATAPAPESPRASEPQEVLILEMPAAMVQPLKVRGGMFQVTSRRICFMLDDRVHINQSGAAVLVSAGGVSEPETEGRELDGRREHWKDGPKDRLWSLSSLKEVYTRRYALQRSALELFMMDRSNRLFNFGTTNARQKVYKAIVQARPPHLDFILAATQNPERILKRSHLTEQWANREITNFEYLMQLNTLAGRTYNDITQYPVFPWVLTDYTSPELYLEDPRIYRDLSKPVGALNETRLKKYLERYESFEDPIIPKFHYSSHYSSSAAALYYLGRIEPFTTLSIQLQGGKFHHAERIFSDIASTWNGVLEDMNNVKELVPELFYLPEALLNENEIDLGDSRTGEKLGNVKLPPWASSPVDFIQKHRAALESDYVSDHLHEWIDLVFGYKQRGPDAVAASNVFLYTTYQGAVDVDKIVDPVLRKTTRDRIMHSGQTSSQLLTTPHIKRASTNNVLHLQTVFRNLQATKAYAIPSPDLLNVPASELRIIHDAIVAVGMGVPACHVAVHRWQANTPDGKGNPFCFQHGRSGVPANSGSLMRMFRGPADGDEDSRYPKFVTLAPLGVKLGTVVAVTPDGRYLLTGGHADNSLKVIATDTAHAVEMSSGHCAPITCLGLSPDGTTLVTGSKDATAILWHILGSSSAATNARALSGTSDPATVVEAAAAAGIRSSSLRNDGSMVDFRRRHVEGPMFVLRGHVDELICCCVSTDLDLVVSSSHTRGVLLHSIAQGRFLRRLPVERADVVALSPEGIIIVFNKLSRVLQTFTVNGKLIASKLLPSWEGSISSLMVSKDGLHAVIGTSCAKPGPPAAASGRSQSKSAPPVPAGGGHHQNSQLPRSWAGAEECAECGERAGSHAPACRQRKPQADNPAGISCSVSVKLRPPSHDNTSGMRRTGSVGTYLEPTYTVDPQPAIILLELYTLEVMQKFMLKKGQDITALALNHDNSNLVVSTANRQLLVFTDPSLSIKVADQMHRFGWDGRGAAGVPS